MPLVRIALRRGKSPQYLQALQQSVYLAMTEAFDVPANDRFILISQHEPQEFHCDRHYLGIERSDALVIVQITCNSTRSTAQKQAFYARLAERLAASPGLRPQDVFVNLVEAPKENWSFGDGIAQYA